MRPVSAVLGGKAWRNFFKMRQISQTNRGEKLICGKHMFILIWSENMMFMHFFIDSNGLNCRLTHARFPIYPALWSHATKVCASSGSQPRQRWTLKTIIQAVTHLEQGDFGLEEASRCCGIHTGDLNLAILQRIVNPTKYSRTWL
jgi:hypothetical protein